MRIFDGLDDVRPQRFRSPVVTIGVFDGVHRGHRAVLARTREMASRTGGGGEVVVVTFDVHPRAVTEGSAPPLVTSLAHRLHLLRREGADTTIVLRFDGAFREMPAERFVEDVLVQRIGVRGVVAGHDTHFGHHRRGDAALLESMLAPRRIPVERTAPVTMEDGTVVSSSTIRAAVLRGDLDAAAALLGRPPALFGTVVRGDGRGRTLGFPTANLDLGGELRPGRGVYGAWVELDGSRYAAVANIGGRPTFHPEGDVADAVEVHVIDWPEPGKRGASGSSGASGDLYGRTLEAFLLGKIRDERRFSGADELKAQIARDVTEAKARIADSRWRV